MARKPAKPTYQKLQADYLKLLGLKEGSRVQVNQWAGTIPGYEGDPVEELEESLLEGKVNICDIYNGYIMVENKDYCSAVPFTAISPVGNIIKISDDYDAEIKEDGSVSVGCQDVSFETLEEIYETACEKRAENGY